MLDPEIPYNDLPLLPPALKELFESPKILKKAIEAHRELAQLKGMGLLLPNQAILIQSIGLQESRVSSEIENIVTTNDELYRSFADEGRATDPQTKEVLRYNDALWFGFRQLKEKGRLLTTPLFEELVQIITQTMEGVRKLPGTQLKNPLENKVVYSPPEGEALIRDKLENLVTFIYREDTIDPLIKLALLHYQFEAIHPFHDGNGRTGRILNILFLVDQGLIDFPILYLSKFIIENKARYYSGLQNVTANEEWEEWILYILEGVKQTAKQSREKIESILELMASTGEIIKAKLPRIYSRDLVELLFEHPYCKIKFLLPYVHRQTASTYLQELEKIGIVRSFKKGTEKYFVNEAFLEILVNF